MGIQRRPQDGVQPLQFPRAGPVVRCKEVVQSHDDGDGDQEPRDDNRNQYERSNNIRGCHQEHSHRVRDGVVDGVDVLGEPVHDPSERSSLEETHGSAHDGDDGPTMENL
jgi:hypothetical protein